MARELDYYYSYVTEFMARFSQGEKTSRIDHMNYRAAIKQIYLNLAAKAFVCDDFEKYREYNARADEAENQLNRLQVDRTQGKPRRVGGGLEDFKGIRRQLSLKYISARGFSSITK
jgi:hypothetical protein